MADRPSVYEISQIGVETVEGTLVPAAKRLSAAGIDLGIGLTVSELLPMGYNLPVLEDPTKQWTTVRAGGELTYTEIVYYLSSLLQAPTPTTAGVISDLWTFAPSSTATSTTKTFTIEQGQAARAQRAVGCRFDGMTITLDRNAGCKFTATGIGQLFTDGVTLTALTPASQIDTVGLGAASAGTVTLTIVGASAGGTTASIAYNATTAAVQAAVNAAIGAGNCTVSGAGPWPAALTFTFAGSYGNQPVAVTGTPTGLTGGTITITATTPGVASEVPLVPMLGSQLDIFLDPTSGGFGVTKLLRATKLDLNISGRFGTFFAANSANGSYATTIPAAGKVSGTLMLEADPAGMAQLTNMTAGSTFYLRGKQTGAQIESGQNYLFQEDLCVKIAAAPTFSVDQGARMITYPFNVVHDAGYGRGYTFTVENLLGSL